MIDTVCQGPICAVLWLISIHVAMFAQCHDYPLDRIQSGVPAASASAAVLALSSPSDEDDGTAFSL